MFDNSVVLQAGPSGVLALPWPTKNGSVPPINAAAPVTVAGVNEHQTVSDAVENANSLLHQNFLDKQNQPILEYWKVDNPGANNVTFH